MDRRETRLRREFVYRRTIEARDKSTSEKRERLKRAFDDGKQIPTDLRREAAEIESALAWQDSGGEGLEVSEQDDEYRWAGVEDPRVVVTTSRAPSARLREFAKEVRQLVPGAQRVNRGRVELPELVRACKANRLTDLLILHEHRGVPNALTVSHLPFGPTAHFSLRNVIMRHEVPDAPPASEQKPHLLFRNFSSVLGKRVMSVLKFLFPVPPADSRRVVTFANDSDYIIFRQHTFKMVNGRVELQEIGPRFELKLYALIRGTLEHEDAADVEWVARPFMHTARKRLHLSDETHSATVTSATSSSPLAQFSAHASTAHSPHSSDSNSKLGRLKK